MRSIAPLESRMRISPERKAHAVLCVVDRVIFVWEHRLNAGSLESFPAPTIARAFVPCESPRADALSEINSGCLAGADFLFVFRNAHCERVDVPQKLRLAIPRHLKLAFAA